MPASGQIHAQMVRIFDAVRLALGRGPGGEVSAAELARLLNTSDQLISNWSNRGPSKDGLLSIQATFGINATWVESGRGPMFIEGAVCVGPQGGAAAGVFRQGGQASVLTLREPVPESDSPFSLALRQALRTLDKAGRLRVENLVRAHLGLPFLDEAQTPAQGNGGSQSGRKSKPRSAA